MAVRTDVFPDGLIAAIDGWQSGSRNKAPKARRLQKWARHLPSKYRALNDTVFRQMRINTQLGIGIAFGAIPERISSWTTSLEIAQRFRESDQDREKVMIIFARRPSKENIILNLNAVYGDGDFLDTVNAAAAQLKKRFPGIERWHATQKEMVLDETILKNDEIVSLGAFRQLNDVVPLLGTPDPTAPADNEILALLTGTTSDEHFWTSPESASNGVRQLAQRTHEYLANKRLWPTELPC